MNKDNLKLKNEIDRLNIDMKEVLKEASNQQLEGEVKRRIRAGEWRIETDYEDTYGDSSVRYISSISFPVETKKFGKVIKNERRFLEVSDLLGEQDEKDEKRLEKEIKKDNDRPKVWEKMEGLVRFDIETKGGWGSKNLIVRCKYCLGTFGEDRMDKHVYLNWSKWKETNDVRQSTILSMIEYEWEAHLVQGHETERRAWTEERQKFPKYDEWLKTKNEGLWRARWMNNN